MPKIYDASPSSVIVPTLNREAWLTEVARQIEPFFVGFSLLPYKVTCGWPSRFALGKKSRFIGQCHYPPQNLAPEAEAALRILTGTDSGVQPTPKKPTIQNSPSVTTKPFHEIFISPLIDDSVMVAGVLTHEMTHVVAGSKAGHGPKFARICHHVGLTEGKPTHASPGKFLETRLRRIVERQGNYPHVAIVTSLREKKPSSAISLTCENCGCKVSISKKWISESGPPTCGCGGEMS